MLLVTDESKSAIGAIQSTVNSLVVNNNNNLNVTNNPIQLLGSIGADFSDEGSNLLGIPSELAVPVSGAWTGVIGGVGGTSGQTYSAQAGRFIKIGRFVWCVARITLTNAGTITGNAQIEGLPFKTSAYSDPGGSAVPFWNNLNTAYVFVSALPASASNVALLFGATAAATGLAAIPGTDITNTTDLIVSFSYEAEG